MRRFLFLKILKRDKFYFKNRKKMKLIIKIILIVLLVNNSIETCLKKLRNCTIYYNVKSSNTGLNYNITSYGLANDINECCDNCANLKDECSIFGYFDNINYCVLFTGIKLSDLAGELVENIGTNFGAIN